MKNIGLLKAMKLCKDYEKMSEEQKQEIRKKRLEDIVKHAREHSPYYKTLYQNVPQDYKLTDLPPTNKKTLMQNWDDWACDREISLEEVERFMKNTDNIGRKIRKKYLVFTTSGSTGNPLVSIYDKTANNVMSAIGVCRSYARGEDLKAFIKRGGKSIGVFADEGFYLGNSSIRARLRTMPWKKKQLAVSSALYPTAQIVRQLNEFQPDMLGGYPSNLELLIDEAKEGRLNISPVIIMTGGEYLSDNLRKRLAETFHCYVQTSYSCTEGGTMACECRKQHFHINDDWVIVEPVDAQGNPVPDGVQADKIYLTNLYNFTQPYIRYEVTDRVIMHHEPCGCGNPAPWLELEGRNDDVTSFIEDGKEMKVAPLAIYAVLKEVHSIRRFQVLVHPNNKVELRIEEKDGVSKAEAFEAAKRSLEAFLSTQNIHAVTITLSEELPKQNAKSGKFKHIINAE
ncbi:MAG: phenylacetate--CoA ligase family protein [bacterium]|nr:phenylacetate--CoA ligase family protein [bacterium]